MNHYLSLVVSILIGIGGQISFKAGTAEREAVSRHGLFNPYVVTGAAAYGLALLFYLHALKKIPVSVAFPSVSISYVAVAFLAHVIWGEPFGLRQIIALVLIGLGIMLLFQGQP